MAAEKRGSPWRTREEGSLLLASLAFAARRLRGLLRLYGVDGRAFEELLRARILQAFRSEGPGGAASGLTMLVLLLLFATMLGMMTGLIALLTKRAELWVVASQSALFLLIWFVLLTQFAGLLVDPADIRVLAPHPVSGRTLLAVRLAHAFFYLALCSLGFTFANVFLAVLRLSPLPVLLLYPLLSLLCAVVALGTVALVFALLLRLVGPDRFQRVALWTQIVVGASTFGLQGVVRLLPRSWLDSLGQGMGRLADVWPPVQYAALFALARGELDSHNLVLAALALGLPLAALALTLTLAARYYAAGLDGSLEISQRKRPPWRPARAERLFLRGSPPRNECAGFGYTLALSRREPMLLRAVLPLCIGMQAMSLGMLGIGQGMLWLYLTLSTGSLVLLLPALLEGTQYAAVSETRWLLLVAPVREESELLRGGTRAHFLGWWLPTALVALLVQTLVAGPAQLPGLVLGHGLTAAVALRIAARYRLAVPFSLTQGPGASPASFENVPITMASFLVYGLLVPLYLLLAYLPWTAWIGLPVAGLLLVRGWRKLDGMTVAPNRRLRSLEA